MISCKFQFSCGQMSSLVACINNGHVHTTDYKGWQARGTNCYISKRTWPLPIQSLNCWSRSHDDFIYMGTDLKIQSLRTINNPANQRRSLKLQANLYYTKYPLLISIIYANFLCKMRPTVLLSEKENRGYLFEIKGDL
jgi:hypothetical protein